MFCDEAKSGASSFVVNLFFGIVIVCLFILFFGRMTFISRGEIVGSLQGFDVDSKGNIYIGAENKIIVINNGEQVESIVPPTNRSYCFYIDSDVLYIGCASDSKGGAYDLDGNEISYGGFSYSQIKEKAKGRSFIVDKHEYTIRYNYWGAYTVTRDGNIVYQTARSFFEGFTYWFCLVLLSVVFVFFVLVKLSQYYEA